MAGGQLVVIITRTIIADKLESTPYTAHYLRRLANPIENALRGENWGKIGEGDPDRHQNL